MSRYTLVELLGGVIAVMCHDRVIGHVAKGDLHEQSDGTLIIRGSRWVVIGYEYISFRKMSGATEALFHSVDHLHNAAHEIAVVRRLESLRPIYRSLARRSTEDSVKELSSSVSKTLRTSKKKYHRSMKRAGLSKYVH